jgi:hypothetical protein
MGVIGGSFLQSLSQPHDGRLGGLRRSAEWNPTILPQGVVIRLREPFDIFVNWPHKRMQRTSIRVPPSAAVYRIVKIYRRDQKKYRVTGHVECDDWSATTETVNARPPFPVEPD